MKFYRRRFYSKFIAIVFLFSISKSDSPKSILFEILSLPKGSTLNEKTFNKFVEELESRGIVDDELSDGFEFIGGPKGFYNYIESNAARLVIELGGELDLQKKQNAEILDTGTSSNSLMQNEFFFFRFEFLENEEQEILNRKHTDLKNYILGLNISKPIILSKTTELYDRNSSSAYGAYIVLPYSFKRASRFIERIVNFDKPTLSLRPVFGLRNFYFKKVVNDSIVEVFGGSDYFSAGLYDTYIFNNLDIDLVVLFGGNENGDFGFFTLNNTQIPIKFFKNSLKFFIFSNASIIRQKNSKITGWIDFGLSIRLKIDLKWLNPFIVL